MEMERRISNMETTRKAKVKASQEGTIIQHGCPFLPRMVKSFTRLWKARTIIGALITTDGHRASECKGIGFKAPIRTDQGNKFANPTRQT